MKLKNRNKKNSKYVVTQPILLENSVLLPIQKLEIETISKSSNILFGKIELIAFVWIKNKTVQLFSNDETLELNTIKEMVPELDEQINSAKTLEEVL